MDFIENINNFAEDAHYTLKGALECLLYPFLFADSEREEAFMLIMKNGTALEQSLASRAVHVYPLDRA